MDGVNIFIHAANTALAKRDRRLGFNDAIDVPPLLLCPERGLSL
jgi:hypothetical protein